jgi:hypothetical protein
MKLQKSLVAALGGLSVVFAAPKPIFQRSSDPLVVQTTSGIGKELFSSNANANLKTVPRVHFVQLYT